MILIGALNLLNRVYGHAASGLRRVTIAGNTVVGIFSVLTGFAGHPTAAEWAVVLCIFGGMLLLSMFPGARPTRTAG